LWKVRLDGCLFGYEVSAVSAVLKFF